jgi:DNA-binding MarR family transcriptional regulator
MPPTPTAERDGLAAFAAALDEFTRASARARSRLAHEGDISLSQYHLLEPLLDAERALGVGELACAAGVSPPTATRMLAGLERDGVVDRRSCAQDRRVVHVVPTARGRALLAAKRERMRVRREELFASLEPGERDQAARLLTRLAAAIEAMR